MATEAPAAVPAVKVAESGEQPPHRSAKGRSPAGLRWWPGAVCLGLYVACSVLEFGWSNPLGAGRIAGSLGEDQIDQIWFIDWAQYALAHLHNPFFSNWQGYPVGLNVVADTSMLFLGVIFLPITALFGPVATWDVLTHLALVLSAFSMCLALRRWTTWWPAAFVGGLLYGFSPYATSDVNHLFLYFVPLPPLMFLLLHETLVRQRWRPARTGALLGALCGAQYLISSEILVLTVLMGAAATVLYLLACRRDLASKWPYVRTSLLYGVLVGGVLLAYPVLFTLFGPEHLNGPPQAPNNLAVFHSDLLSPILPGSGQLIGAGAIPLARVGFDYSLGIGMYLGIPLVIALVSIVVWLRRRGAVVLAGCMTVIAFIMSMGSTLYVDGHDTHIPLPFLFLQHLPFIDGIDAARFALFATLFAAFILGVGLDEFHRRLTQSTLLDWLPRSWHDVVAALVPMALAAIVGIALLPESTEQTTSSPVPSFFTSNSVSHIASGSAVLAYPYPEATPPAEFYAPQPADEVLLDQAVSGMRFRVIGGYGWWPVPNSGQNINSAPALEPLSVQTLFDACFFGTATPAQAALLAKSDMSRDLRSFMHKHQVGAVVVLPVGNYPSIVTSALTGAIGPPSHVGGATVWFHVQQRLETTRMEASPLLRTFLKAPPETNVVKPAGDAQLSGVQFLDASASSKLGVRSVQFRIAGEGRTISERGVPSPYGWITEWNTRSVPDGTYTVSSLARGNTGLVTTSTGVVIRVKN
jgi:hypothetical protein